jgi:hypothetical protein
MLMHSGLPVPFFDCYSFRLTGQHARVDLDLDVLVTPACIENARRPMATR